MIYTPITPSEPLDISVAVLSTEGCVRGHLQALDCSRIHDYPEVYPVWTNFKVVGWDNKDQSSSRLPECLRQSANTPCNSTGRE